MKRLIPLLLILFAAGCGSTPAPLPSPSSSLAASPSIPGTPTPSYTWPSHVTCGRERWAVKTATDPAAHGISSQVVDTTVFTLVHQVPPSPIPVTRTAPVETTIYRVHATLVGFKEEADSDYHLILVASGQSMIAEIPDPPCAKGSLLLGGIETARAEFDALWHASSFHFTRVSVPVIVTGVGFFDFDHGQDGVAPNAIELHPVLDIQLDTSGSGQ